MPEKGRDVWQHARAQGTGSNPPLRLKPTSPGAESSRKRSPPAGFGCFPPRNHPTTLGALTAQVPLPILPETAGCFGFHH